MKNIIVTAIVIASVIGGVVTIPAVSVMMKPYFNTVDYVGHKIDDSTKYESKKKVEDTCRAMISSYTSDSLAYEQYKDSEDETKRSWSDQAKMRANKTASTYNNYILENSFLWAGNVPKDIKDKLDYLN